MAPTHDAHARLRFGDYKFDPATSELYRDDLQVPLQAQPRKVLAALLTRPGELVTREELRDRLWKGDTFVDFEHGLNTAIKKVRQTLGDSAETPRYIETLARRGYRFLAPVVREEEQPSPVDLPPAAPVELARGAWTSALGLKVLAAVVAGVVAMMLWTARTPPRQSIQRGAPAQLAVMPLRVLSGDGSTTAGYLGVGIADAITTRLVNVRQLAVRPTSAVLPYRDGAAEPARIAEALGVEHLLVGSIHQGRQTYRVTVQLVRADGVAVWGRTYDLPRADLLRLQDNVAEQVVAALRLELTLPERARLRSSHTANPAAYDAYLRGRTLLLTYTDASMREAIEHFERALAIDQSFALARAALAMACAWFSVRYAYETEAAVWASRAEEEARRALDIDASLADAHLALASAAGTMHRGFDWASVLKHTEAALALDPSLDLAHGARMRALYHLGLFDRARHEAQRARSLNPTSPTETARVAVAVELFAGEFEAAADQAEALRKRTDAPAARHYLGLSRYYLGDVSEAREILSSIVRGGRPDVRAQASLASVEAAAGLRDRARDRVIGIERGTYMDHHVAYSLGAAWAQIGDPRAATAWLRRSADTGFPCYPWYVRDPLLDPVRADPAFKQFISQLAAQHRSALR